MSIANQEMIRDNNRRLVLEYLVNHPPASRAELAKSLNIPKTTISNIFQDLLKQNLVLEIGSTQTAMGRKPLLLESHNNCGYALAIDVRPNQIITLAANLKGKTARSRNTPFTRIRSFSLF